MRNLKIFLSLVLCLLIGFKLILNAGDNLTGIDIIKKADAANKSKKGIVKKGVMELVNLESQQKETRKFIILSVATDEGEKSMFRFTDSSYAGTTFLSIKKGDKTLMYIYLKSIGAPRQVEGSDKEATFVDTDIANEEMSGGITEDYEYKRIENKKIDDSDCYVVERYPKSKSSKYQKHIVVIDKNTLKTLIMKSYSKEGRLVKTIKQDKIKKVAENIYEPTEITVTDLEKKHSTILKISEIMEKEINQGYFSKERMGKKWVEE
jgi:hypothetical protein